MGLGVTLTKDRSRNCPSNVKKKGVPFLGKGRQTELQRGKGQPKGRQAPMWLAKRSTNAFRGRGLL